MTSHRTTLWTAAVVVAGLAFAAAAQESKTPPRTKTPLAPATAPAAPQAMPPAPKPGPEQAVFSRDAGTWDAKVEMRMGPPGAPPEVSSAVETNELIGGLWIVNDFKGTMGQQPFHGHGTFGYDTWKKKYVGVWVDTMATSPLYSEGTYDAATNTLTMIGAAVGPDGKAMKLKQVVAWTGPNTKTFTMYMAGPDGKEFPGMVITYKRRS